MKSGFNFRLKFSFLCVCILINACQPASIPEPACRVNAEYSQNQQGPAACIVRINNKLMVIQNQQGKYQLSIGEAKANRSAQCAAHHGMWLDTGMNVEVEQALGIQADGTWLFACKLEAGFEGNEPALPPPPWSRIQNASIHFIDPFTIEIDNWQPPEHFIIVRDAYVAHGNQ